MQRPLSASAPGRGHPLSEYLILIYEDESGYADGVAGGVRRR